MDQATTTIHPIAIVLPEAIGTPFEGGFYGGRVRIADAIAALVWAPKALGETKGRWLDRYADVPSALSCFDSMANTRAMLESGSALAKWALALDINGYTDWCLPARDVLELGYRYLKPTAQRNLCSFRDGDNASSIPPGYPYTEQVPLQTSAALFREGGSEAFEEAIYATSTQYSDYGAFGQDFDNGYQDYRLKESEARARAVRLIQLSA